METTSLSQMTNPHIEVLRPVLSNAENPVEWLVIAHNDAQLVRSLDTALSGYSAAVLQLSQDTWEFGDSHLAKAVTWAVQQLGIINLVLVGHSGAGGTKSFDTFVTPGSDPDDGDPASYSRLLSGARYTSSRIREAQRRFSQQFRHLTEIPIVQECIRRDELTTYALFYRAEDGLFLELDSETEDYKLLLN